MCPCYVNNFMKYLFENKLINYSMVLVCLYLIEVGVHRYVGSTQNLIGRLGDHYRRSLSDDSTGPLSTVMRRSKYLDEIFLPIILKSLPCNLKKQKMAQKEKKL